MEITIRRVTDWTRVLEAARMTVHKGRLEKEPTYKFKVESLISAHSPKRELEFDIIITGVPFYVMGHLVRHHIGCEKFVATSREDRTGILRDERKQTDLVDMMISANAESIINISQLRLCSTADPETRRVWRAVVSKLAEVEPLLAKTCVPQCVYRGRCPEPICCGYSNTEAHHKAVDEYWALIGR